MKIIIINIDGSIGGGKTTLVKLISEKLKNVHIVEENVDSEEGKKLLQNYYNDQKMYAFQFDKFILESKKRRIGEIIEKIKNNNEDVHYVVFDRSIKYDMIFTSHRLKNGFINEAQHDELFELADEIFSIMIVLLNPEKILNFFISTDFETCWKRILKRCREGEKISEKESFEIYSNHQNLHKSLYLKGLEEELDCDIVNRFDDFMKHIK